MISDVFNAIPPKNPAVGEGQINEFGYLVNSSIQVLSPNIDPPVHWDDGSIANTARFSLSYYVM